ncbi:MAG TPA: hypothetical protein VKG80_06215 [Trebonia sp.]|nr:hypothetical protein [Trebonia sp.]
MADVQIRPLTPDDDMDAQVDLGQRGAPEVDAALEAAFATTTFMVDDF